LAASEANLALSWKPSRKSCTTYCNLPFSIHCPRIWGKVFKPNRLEEGALKVGKLHYQHFGHRVAQYRFVDFQFSGLADRLRTIARLAAMAFFKASTSLCNSALY
jgi:hypothetical protein